ncbi:SDR family NAD(P)-dependent oxidoreductase [Propionibacterium australiense]|uniref:SDR family NAD(P)-dependent oxidoreductase n=1 Tax=Propionibacterium australiense TaxID=119981 RepID=A0A383S701_9ACTN|nr:SDR family NAD(P)-dependent oxidoreductase [Propionibacterium australiense]RLP07113.1 SDR family NAD(P)-dependent oxidoreductase [Propionibacterium australiense]RLP07881.1 SDR family NAD(P)-dependent oxidoreductase [Propionibacterium australiense]SYZ33785.1 Short-chain dehydrogenase/reductase SDR [Propionibacterium australiense]VEH88762.1 3-oxoacyl-[acyl-carrier-protein] reductase FabG [Propionibacterium australiense]
MSTALVTGGSSGIGLAFADALAARGDDLVLVARDTARLEAAARQLRGRHRVTVETLSADLTSLDGIRSVESFIESHEIATLVNNAGFAAHTDLLGADWSGQVDALNAMALAVLVLSGAAGRQMTGRGAGEIVNVSSINALIDADVYSATKRWVIGYTEALAGRLSGTGVHATVVLPGWVRTNYHAAAGMRRPHLPGWAWTSPGQVAAEALAAVAAGRVQVTPKAIWKVAGWVLRHGPAWLPRRVAAGVRRGHDKQGAR